MFSVDCSLHWRKFALSFSLWSRALNPFLLQIQSPLLREVLPFIVNPRFFIARAETILHEQWKNDFWESRFAALSAHFGISLRQNFGVATSYPKVRTLINAKYAEGKTLTNHLLMRSFLIWRLYRHVRGRQKKYRMIYFTLWANDFLGRAWQNEILVKKNSLFHNTRDVTLPLADLFLLQKKMKGPCSGSVRRFRRRDRA